MRPVDTTSPRMTTAPATIPVTVQVAAVSAAGAEAVAQGNLMSAVRPAGQSGFAATAGTSHSGAEPWEVNVLTAREVAQLLRCNLKTVYESARAGTLPCVRLGRSFRFSREAILASLQTCKSASRRKEH